MKTLLATPAALLALAAPAQADVCSQIELHKQLDHGRIKLQRDLAISNDNTQLMLSDSAWDHKAIENGCVTSPNFYY
jgi:hypothetical protein